MLNVKLKRIHFHFEWDGQISLCLGQGQVNTREIVLAMVYLYIIVRSDIKQ